MTASNAWPDFPRKRKQRSTIRWQHRLKREHPTCTERKPLNKECGWKGGDSGNSAGRKNIVQRKNKRTHLTPTGLLMEGVSAQNPSMSDIAMFRQLSRTLRFGRGLLLAFTGHLAPTICGAASCSPPGRPRQKGGGLGRTALQPGESSLADLFQAQLAIVLLGNPVALTGGVFQFLAVHDRHCATGVLDELLLLQNTSCQAHGRPICP